MVGEGLAFYTSKTPFDNPVTFPSGMNVCRVRFFLRKLLVENFMRTLHLLPFVLPSVIPGSLICIAVTVFVTAPDNPYPLN